LSDVLKVVLARNPSEAMDPASQATLDRLLQGVVTPPPLQPNIPLASFEDFVLSQGAYARLIDDLVADSRS